MILLKNGLHLHMLQDKALFIVEMSTVCVADLHFGKDRFFARGGMSIPDTLDHDLQRLSAIIAKTNPERILFLGDFIHHRLGVDQDLVRKIEYWLNSYPAVEFVLIRGNHDASLKELPMEWKLRDLDRYEEHGFSFTHDPEPPGAAFNIHGHFHPVVNLRDRRGRHQVRLPCFVLDPHQMTLPSFGVLTGGHPVVALPDRRIFALTDSGLLPLSAD